MSSHLSLTDRTLIERYIALDYSFSYIAHKLRRSPSTIAREIRKHRCLSARLSKTHNDCIYFRNCLRKNLCTTETKYSCWYNCKLCTEYNCTKLCLQYISEHCPKLDKAPYVCTRCPDKRTCKLIQAYYSAHRANSQYLETLRNTRLGPQATPDELLEINSIIEPLLKKGQSLNHIIATHADKVRFSERTIYNYIDRHALSIKNIDLPKKVKYKLRQTEKIRTKFDYICRKERTLENFKEFIQEHPNTSIVEMDTVKGARKSDKVLLTFIFRENNFMLIFPMEDGTQKA